MKEGFSPQEQHNIRRAKQILKQLWKKSGIKQAEILERLAAQGIDTKVSTLSTWFSDSNYFRPKEEHIRFLVHMFCTGTPNDEPVQEILDDLNLLFGYAHGPLTTEMIQNRVASQLSDNTERTLRMQQESLSRYLESLEGLLDEIEPKILEYDKGYPVIYVEAGDKYLLKKLLGSEKELYKTYQVEDGYEIPLTQIRSQEAMADIINNLNEGSRLLRAYIDRHVDEEEGVLLMDFARIEDFVAYAWEISDRLLQNSRLCQAVPILKRTLLRVMTTCWGIRYFIENQTKETSEVKFQNILALKGKTSQADINCSVAVYMGMLARQLLKSAAPAQVKRGLNLFEKAAEMLQKNYEKLNTEQETFFYKKELANLCYDAATSMLPQQTLIPACKAAFEPAMKLAYQHYTEVLQQPNLFYQGLTDQRANHIRMFYMLSFCWITRHLEDGVEEINKLIAGEQFNESFWAIHMAKAIGYSVLYLRARKPEPQKEFFKAATASLHKALLVHGYADRTAEELKIDSVLRQVFPEGVPD